MTELDASHHAPLDAADDRERVDALNALAEDSADGDPRRAIEQAEAARQIASRVGYHRGLADALAILGRLHVFLGRYAIAVGEARQAVGLFEELGDPAAKVRALVVLGRAELVRANHAEGFRYLFEGLQLAQEIGDRSAEAAVLYGFLYGYVVVEDFGRALEVMDKALTIDHELGDLRGEARDLNGRAVALHQVGRFDDALATAQESLRLARAGGFRQIEAVALSTLCEIYEQLGDFEATLDYCGQSLAMGREFGFDIPQLTALIRFGSAYRRAGQIDAAIEHYEAAMALAEEVENRKDVMSCHRELSELHELTGDLSLALAHHRLYSQTHEAIVTDERDRRLQALEAQHQTETARKEAEIHQLRTVALEQEIADRKHAEAELRRYKDHLEEQVVQRTTELINANAKLRESEERYRTLYEDTPSMYFTIDPEGIVLSVNEFGAEQLGYRPDELVGASVLNVFHPEDRDAASAHVSDCLTHPERVFHWELRKVRKDGSGLTVRETARATKAPDGRRVVLVVCEDITDQKRAEDTQERLEAELRQAQKMEAIGRLAGGVAHDFNNLLTAMTGYVELVLEGLEPDSPLRRDAEEARRAAERAASLTSQLLAFSRRQPIRPASINLNEVVSDMEKLLERLIGEDIRLITALAPDLRPIHGDRGQLEQVIVNLAVNARDAMPEGGRLVLETGNAEDEEAAGPPKPYVVLGVTDTGVGIEESIRSRIFEPFFTTKEQGKGTGLGLSTVYGIVEQHRGFINVSEGPGGGTTFRIWLPVSPPTEPVEAPSSVDTDERGTETILLVEDEELIRSLAARVLRGRGYVVLEAPNADEGLRLATQRGDEIDLALSDVIMPGMSGHEFGRLLRERHPAVRLVLMSGYDTSMADGLHQGEETVFLSKPFTPAVLLQTIRRALDTPAV